MQATAASLCSAAHLAWHQLLLSIDGVHKLELGPHCLKALLHDLLPLRVACQGSHHCRDAPARALEASACVAAWSEAVKRGRCCSGWTVPAVGSGALWGDCCRVLSTAAVLGLMLVLLSIQLLQPRNPHNHNLAAKGALVAVKGGTVCSCVCAERRTHAG